MITNLDHLVLTVRDFAATVRFYVEGLGMELREFDEGRHALHFGTQKINLHLAGREFEPKAAVPTPGSADLCFLTERPLAEISARLAALGCPIIEGPGRAHRRHRTDGLDLHPRSRRQSDRDRDARMMR